MFYTLYSIRMECEEFFVKLIKTLKIKCSTLSNLYYFNHLKKVCLNQSLI